MKYKWGAVFICLIICLLSIASVYASDVNETVLTNENQNDEPIEIENQNDNTDLSTTPDENNRNTEIIGISNDENNNTDKLNTPENNEVLTTTIPFSGTTFTELQTTINNAQAGDVITLNKDIKQDKTSEITINKSIRIEGNGHTINALSKSRIFNINSDNVIINNITFINAKHEPEINDNEVYSLGGAVYWNGTNGILANSTFKNNIASLNIASIPISEIGNIHMRIYGGAVYWNGDNGTLTNTTFKNNNVTVNEYISSCGGAVYWNGVNGVVSRSSFADNSVNYGGGAIHSDEHGTVYVSDSSFVNNSAFKGGAIYDPKSVYNCSFEKNSVFDEGGAIFIDYKKQVVINNCIFVSNSVISRYGGGSAISIPFKRAVIGNCSFINNSATYGAIYASENYMVVVGNCSFTNNTGTVYEVELVYNCSFINNTGNYNRAYEVYNCSFINNTAEYGGGITARFVYNCSFINNTATYGGALHSQGILNGEKSITSNCSFINNTATYGGAIFITSQGLNKGATTNNCSFINNTATYGGAIFISRYGDTEVFLMNIYNSTFMNNNEYDIYSRDKLYLENNSCSNFIFFKYTPKYSIVSQSYIVVLNNSTINSIAGHKNTLSFVLKDDNNNTIITDVNMSFILPDGTKLPATLDYNTGIFYADYTFNEEGVYQISAEFDEDITPEKLTPLKGSINIMTDFEYLQELINNAPEGGVINLTHDYVYNTRWDTITKGILINKRLTINGNGYTINAMGKSRIFNINSDNVVLNNINFINANALDDCGGSIYWNGTNGVLTNCSFTNSTATNKGGSIFTYGNQNSINIENNIFNTSQANTGGVIYSETITHLSNNKMYNGIAENGSYIYNANIIDTVYVTILNNSTVVTKREAPITINATLTDDMANPISGGKIIFIIENNPYEVESIQGSASYTYVFDKINKYYINGNYAENRRHNAIVSGATINVEGITTNLNVTGLDVKIGEDTTITATLTDDTGNPLYNRTILITFNGETINRTTDTNGLITMLLETSDLAGGFHDITLAYGGDNIYNSTKLETQVNIKFNGIIKITMLDGLKLTAVLTDEKGNPVAGATLSYTLDDEESVNATTNEKGELICNIKSNCVLTINYSRDNDTSCNASITLKNLKPVPKDTKILVEKAFKRDAVDYNAGERGYKFYFTLTDADGKILTEKPVKIGVDGKTYNVKTDKDGKAGLMINLATSNFYTYAITFLGDDDYKASFAVSRLNVVKKATTITPAKTTYSFKSTAKTKTITATLKSTNQYIPSGKQVTLTIAGKTFKATIGAKGQISLNIGSFTTKGTYKVTIKFAGTGTYAASTSKTITVKIS